jgi:hypothetical protein
VALAGAYKARPPVTLLQLLLLVSVVLATHAVWRAKPR